MDDLLSTADWDEASKKRLSTILRQLYRKTRNPFYHAGKYADEADITMEYLAKIDKTTTTLDEELGHGEPRLSGVLALENLLRLAVLQRLAELESATED